MKIKKFKKINKKGEELTHDTFVSALLLFAGIVAVSIFLFGLYHLFWSGPDGNQKDNLERLANEIRFNLNSLNYDTEDSGSHFPFWLSKDYVLASYKNDPECHNNFCICLTDKDTNLKKYYCEELSKEKYPNLEEVSVENAQDLSVDQIVDVNIFVKNVNDKIFINIFTIKVKKDDSVQVLAPEEQIKKLTSSPLIAKGSYSQKIESYLPQIVAASKKYNVPVDLIIGIISTESNADTLIISPCGAAGLVQLMPSTAQERGISNIFAPDKYLELLKQRQAEKVKSPSCIPEYANLLKSTIAEKSPEEIYKLDGRFDPSKSIDAGTNYLSTLLKYPLLNSDIRLSIAAYNAGPGSLKSGRGVIGACCNSNACDSFDLCSKRLATETANYPAKVLGYAKAAQEKEKIKIAIADSGVSAVAFS